MRVIDADIELSDVYCAAMLHIVTKISVLTHFLNEGDISNIFGDYLDWLVNDGMDDPPDVPSYVRMKIQDCEYIFPVPIIDEIHRELSSLINKYAVPEGEPESDAYNASVAPFSGSIN